jgi:hypothetical protein
MPHASTYRVLCIDHFDKFLEAVYIEDVLDAAEIDGFFIAHRYPPTLSPSLKLEGLDYVLNPNK